MRTDIATFSAGLKSTVDEVRSVVSGGWETLVQFRAQHLGDISSELLWGATGAALVLVLTSWRWWRRRREAKRRVQTALKALLSPPPQIKPAPRENIPLRLEKRKDRVTSRPFPLPAAPVVSGFIPVEASSPLWPVPSPPPAVLSPSSSANSPVKLTADLLRRLEWKRFELLIQRDFEARGIRVACTCVGVEGGVDLHLYQGDELQPYGFVQCHAHAAQAVTLDQISAFFELMAAARVEGTFVTTGTFTPGAQAWAQTKGVALLSGDAVVARFNALPATTRAGILDEVTAGDYVTPTCRSCDVKLVAEGASSPDAAWVCPRAPRCTYTLPNRVAAAVRSGILDAPRPDVRSSGVDWNGTATV